MGSCEGSCNFCKEFTLIRIWCDICCVNICEECRIDETDTKQNRLICINCIYDKESD